MTDKKTKAIANLYLQFRLFLIVDERPGNAGGPAQRLLSIDGRGIAHRTVLDPVARLLALVATVVGRHLTHLVGTTDPLVAD